MAFSSIWRYHDDHAIGSEADSADGVLLDVYEEWLEPPASTDSPQTVSKLLQMGHREQRVSNSFDRDDHAHHDHADHVHLSTRQETEAMAADAEGETSPGELIAAALVRILEGKGLFSAAQLLHTVQELDACGQRLLGGLLVAHAWKDPSFKARLLHDRKIAR